MSIGSNFRDETVLESSVCLRVCLYAYRLYDIDLVNPKRSARRNWCPTNKFCVNY